MIEFLQTVDWTQLPQSFWYVLSEMAPYLLFGFLVAGLLSVLISPEVIERHLGGHGIWPVLKASLFGVPLPLCSCGVIPVSASLRRHGASPGSTISFLISTPQTGVDSIAVTYSLLGVGFAVFRPLAAMVSGVLGGLVVSLLGRPRNALDSPEAAREAETCTDACCTPIAADGATRGRLSRILHYGFVDLPHDIGKSLMVGLVIAALITVLVPDDFFGQYLGGFFGQGIGLLLVMMALGVPMYVCATASVPMAMALMIKGASPGAALVFLMTGPATNAATLAMIWRVMGGRTAIVYLLSMVVIALGSGLALDYIFTMDFIPPAGLAHGEMAPPAIWQQLSGVVLLLVLGYALFSHRLKSHSEGTSVQRATVMSISGMTCSHCAAAVRRALGEVPGVEQVSVDLPAGQARISGDDIDRRQITDAVQQLGYSVEGIEESQ